MFVLFLTVMEEIIGIGRTYQSRPTRIDVVPRKPHPYRIQLAVWIDFVNEVRHLRAVGVCSSIPRKKLRVTISMTNVVRERDTFLYPASNGVSKSIRPIIENGDLDRLLDHDRMPYLEWRAVLGRYELI